MNETMPRDPEDLMAEIAKMVGNIRERVARQEILTMVLLALILWLLYRG